MTRMSMSRRDPEDEKSGVNWRIDPDDRYHAYAAVLVPNFEPCSAWVEERAVEQDRPACVSGYSGVEFSVCACAAWEAADAAIRTGERFAEATGRCWCYEERVFAVPADQCHAPRPCGEDDPRP
jgi:hypothetical protein